MLNFAVLQAICLQIVNNKQSDKFKENIVGDLFVLKRDATSLDSIARQYSGRDGHMEEDGANHLSSCRPLAVLYECVNPGGLALKKEEIHRINVAKWKELYHYAVVERSFPSKIYVPCIMNNEEQTLILKNIGGRKNSVEMTLEGIEGRSVPLEKIHNFSELFKKLERELGLEDMPPHWIDSEGNIKATMSLITHSYPPDNCDNSFASSDRSKSSVSVERSKSSTSSDYVEFLDTFQLYELYASQSSESADLFY